MSDHEKSLRLVRRARSHSAIATAVVYPCSVEALRGALEAADAGIIMPVLVGPRIHIERIARESRLNLSSVPIEDVAQPVQATYRSAEMVQEGRVQVLMKGSLHTDELMKAAASRKAGLLTPRRVSHVFVMDVPTHARLLFVADAAINVAPKLRVKRDITQNAIDCAHATGIEIPKVAVLSAIETVNETIPSTVDAAALRDMAQRGEIVGGIVDGPLAFDNAISAEAARLKGLATPVAGVVDILIVPSIEAGNILYKALVYLNDAVAAGVVMGLRAPIVLTSRADTAASRVAAAAVACLLVHDRKASAGKAT
ncbi:MAG TPA: bifunctional enoyl-CoA hydratase/phosphate acetyltransferase [Burkholderiales bacterium]